MQRRIQQMKCGVVVLLMMLQLVWVETGASSPDHCINYDPDFDDVASYWNNSTWHPSPDPADYWIKAENGIITLYYKGNRTDWGNTEVYQGKKPAFEVEKPLRVPDFHYKEGSGSLRLSAKVRRDIDPVWQGLPLSLKSPYPQANIGVYLWCGVQDWNYDDWNNTSSLVIDIYFDSRHQDPCTNETIVWEVGGGYPPTSTPYDPQIHVGYVVGTLPLNSSQELDVDVSALIDRTLQECRDREIELPSNELVIKFLGVCVDSFSAAVQASFDHVSLIEDTTPPSISVKSPENKTYPVNDVPLAFTVSELTSWIGYSLDSQNNVTISCNTTLFGLSNGPHTIIIYVNDTVGNMGASEMVYFTIKMQQEEAFPTWIVAMIVIIAVFGVALLVYFTKVKKTTDKIQ